VVDELSGKCLDVSGASTADGAAVIQLVAVHSGKCVDVSGVSTTPGALVHQWTCDPASALGSKRNQIWRLSGKAP
jgi:hypothetical protein